MQKRRHTKLPDRTAGFTMVELLLVLAVLSLLAGIAWPILSGAYDRYLFKREVEKVRSTMAKARVHAMETGETYQFLFQPGGRFYVVVPRSNNETGPDGGVNPAAKFPVVAGRLPKGYEFEYVDTPQGAASGSIPDQFLAQLPNAMELKQANWSVPIVFYAEGEAEAGPFRVKDESKRTVTLSVRILTGAVSVSKITQASR